MKQLFKMMAQANLRTSQIKDIHRKSLLQIPAKQEAINRQLQQLATEIRQAGLGSNPQLEDKYLSLVRDRQLFDQSWHIGDRKGALTEPAPPLDERLNKAIAWGELILSVYGESSLVKGSLPDIIDAINLLESFNRKESEDLSNRLKSLVKFR
ncbi:MAG: hypothetical protein LRZ84_14800 [Desertifilum sp.]|nr:hypothetical protein [Desertifilum sp.]